MFSIFKSKRDIVREECWNLDYELLKWLREHLIVFEEDASEIVNLEYKTYTYKKKKFSQLEIIEKLIDDIEMLLNSDIYFDRYEKDDSSFDADNLETVKDEIYDLLKLVHWNMWW